MNLCDMVRLHGLRSFEPAMRADGDDPPSLSLPQRFDGTAQRPSRAHVKLAGGLSWDIDWFRNRKKSDAQAGALSVETRSLASKGIHSRSVERWSRSVSRGLFLNVC